MSVNINPQTQTVEDTRKLRSSGSSLVISIPPEIVQSLDWEQGDKLHLSGDWETGEMSVSKR